MQYFNTTRLCQLFDITIPDDPHIYYDDALMPKGKIKSSNAGIPCSEETKKLLSEANKGQGLGRKLSEETRLKMKLSASKRPPRKHTEATKLKMSIVLRGKKHTEETKAKMRVRSGARTHSEETKQKMRDSALKRWTLNAENPSL